MIAVSVISTFAIPLAASLVVLFGGALNMRRLSCAAAVIGGVATSAAGVTLLFIAARQADPLRVAVGSWLFISGQISLDVTLSLVVDHSAAWLIAVVAFVGGLIVVHTTTASSATAMPWQRICWMLLSVAATAWLLSSGNFLQLIVAWQVLGLATCGLAAGKSAELRRKIATRKTALVLTIGSCGLLVAACGVWSSTGSLEIAQILAAVNSQEFTREDIVAVTGILIAAIAACDNFRSVSGWRTRAKHPLRRRPACNALAVA